jgi:hypothetical protein
MSSDTQASQMQILSSWRFEALVVGGRGEGDIDALHDIPSEKEEI